MTKLKSNLIKQLLVKTLALVIVIKISHKNKNALGTTIRKSLEGKIDLSLVKEKKCLRNPVAINLLKYS